MTRSVFVWGLAISLFARQATAQDPGCLGVRTDLPGPGSLGHSIDVDGDTLVAGDPTNGAVFVFDRSGGDWTEVAQIPDPWQQPSRRFGECVSISGDTFAVGAPFGNGGQVWVYRFDGAQWKPEASFFPSISMTNDRFGIALGLDGDTLVVGSPLTVPAGAVWLFERNGVQWSETGQLEHPLGKGDYGSAIEIAGDWIFVGDPVVFAGQNAAGQVVAFRHNGSAWLYSQFLTQLNLLERLGVSLSLDGDQLAIGTGSGNAVYLYGRQGTQWTEQATLPRGGATDQFGRAVALSGDRLAIGDPNDGQAASGSGAVYVYERDAGTWTEHLKVLHPEEALNGHFGSSAHLRERELAVGSPGVIGTGVYFYAYLPDELPRSYCTGKLNSLGCLPFIEADGCPSVTLGEPFHVNVRQLRNQKTALLFYGIDGPAAIPFQGGTLCIAPPIQRAIPLNSGGHLPPINDCSGVYRLDINAFARGDLGGHPLPELSLPGTRVNCQGFGRDAGDPFGSSLSNGFEYSVEP